MFCLQPDSYFTFKNSEMKPGFPMPLHLDRNWKLDFMQNLIFE